MSGKEKWRKPLYNLLFDDDCDDDKKKKFPWCKPYWLTRVPKKCNPRWPQARVCRSRKVPQRTIQCTHKVRTLS